MTALDFALLTVIAIVGAFLGTKLVFWWRKRK